MGGSASDVAGGFTDFYKDQFENMMKGDLGAIDKSHSDATLASMDPGGLLHTSDDKNLRKSQEGFDGPNYGAGAAKEARLAEAEANKQKTLIAGQKAKVDAEKAKQDKARKERADRMKQNQLLSGSETGVASLLG